MAFNTSLESFSVTYCMRVGLIQNFDSHDLEKNSFAGNIWQSVSPQQKEKWNMVRKRSSIISGNFKWGNQSWLY